MSDDKYIQKKMDQNLNFLGENPTLEQRWQALRLNVQACYERMALANGKTEIGRAGETLWTYNQLTIPSEQALEDDQLIDHILDWYRSQQPLHGAICWYLHPTPPVSLGARLFARGVEPNWQPHWMWLELCQLKGRHPYAENVEIQTTGEADLPNAANAEAPIRSVLARIQPRRIWYLVALQHGQEVGHCMLNVTTGEHGIGGLFDMWVMPEARKQGIGTALAQASCELAGQSGCNHVVLNATEMGEPIYRRVGFQSMGYGYTWYLSERMLAAPAPTSDQVKFLAALGLGDLNVLDEVGQRIVSKALQEPTLNGLTPLEIAVRCQQPASADWLIQHGVIPDILSVWDLGWKERVPALLASHPELVKLRGGQWNATPLHTAIERNDIELAKLLLTVPNDLESKDEEFQSTPLGWARYFKRPEIIKLIKRHRPS